LAYYDKGLSGVANGSTENNMKYKARTIAP